jgi:UDP-glucose-4-epimerase GalE
MAKILVTGGAGYIGSHTTHFLLKQGHDVQVVDNLSKGYRHNVPEGRLHVADLMDTGALDALFAAHSFDAVVHFAACIAVGESMQKPEMYFRNNVAATTNLLDAMQRANVRSLVFSSTAAVYGDPASVPIPESAPQKPVNPYGEGKWMVEQILQWCDRCSALRYVALRYFNACGAEPRFGIGEEHQPETHLIPLILRAVKTGKPVTVFGEDYETPDGTCIRDYIHVMDLAAAHGSALDHLMAGGASHAFNCGTGKGFSVLEVIQAVEKVTGKPVPRVIGARRPGDPPELVADSSNLQKTLGWSPRFTRLEDIVSSAWEFEQHRPV